MSEVLVVGAGGREEAIREAMEASAGVTHVEVSDQPFGPLARFSKSERPLVIIGPEQPLVYGVSDELRKMGYPVFGVSEKVAQYEASKSLSTLMMRQAGVAHPETFITSTLGEALEYADGHDPSDYVIKADGLAAGKGVVLPKTHGEAISTIQNMLSGKSFGDSGRTINLAERHTGPEVSAMVVVGDNDEYVILPLAQDHKRLGDGDAGPNTGGMGAYAPVPEAIVDDKTYSKIEASIQKTLAGMRAFGRPFERGLLYAGFMLSDEPVVIEYNVRFGDPEAQVILPLLRRAGVDVHTLLRSAAEGELKKPEIDLRADLGYAAVTVCLAAEGYPTNTSKERNKIWGLNNTYDNVTIQQAAVKSGRTAGGRVLYVTGTGFNVDSAARSAYAAIDTTEHLKHHSGKVGFRGMQFRRDIANQAMYS